MMPTRGSRTRQRRPNRGFSADRLSQARTVLAFLAPELALAVRDGSAPSVQWSRHYAVGTIELARSAGPAHSGWQRVLCKDNP